MRASSLQRYALCPGSWALEQRANVRELPEAEICESGTAIHAALAGQPNRDLSDDEEELVEQCRDEEGTILADLGSEADVVIVEKEITLPTKPIPISGHPDKILYFSQHKEAVVLDWKLGWMEVTKADRNLQLRAYVLCAKKEFPDAESITAAIVQPRIRGGSVVTVYSKADLKAAWRELLQIIGRAAEAAVDDLHPSPDACRYCPVQAVCPAVRKQIEKVAATELSEADWAKLTPAFKIQLWDTIQLVEGVIATLKAQIRADLEEDPEHFGGELVFGTCRKLRVVSDPVGAYQSVSELGVSAADFASCCKVGLTRLKEEVRKVTGLKGKALEAKVNEALEPHLTINEARPTIERKHVEA